MADYTSISLLCAEAVLYPVLVGVLYRWFGKAGVYTFLAVAAIAANLLVLKAAWFWPITTPIALGTPLFAATFFGTDLLNANHGPRAAVKGVHLGFVGYLVFVLVASLGGAYPAATGWEEVDTAWAVIFTPAPRLFCASVLAYLVSQYTDVGLFHGMRRVFPRIPLAGVGFASTAISGTLDNALFSWLAWRVFAPAPVAWSTLMYTYILGVTGLRVVLALIQAPFLYWARRRMQGA